MGKPLKKTRLKILLFYTFFIIFVFFFQSTRRERESGKGSSDPATTPSSAPTLPLPSRKGIPSISELFCHILGPYNCKVFLTHCTNQNSSDNISFYRYSSWDVVLLYSTKLVVSDSFKQNSSFLIRSNRTRLVSNWLPAALNWFSPYVFRAQSLYYISRWISI